METGLTVIVTSYNGLEYSKLFYDKFKRYTPGDVDLLWVDNASTDGTVDWLQSNRDITVIYNDENIGAGAARNKAIDEVYTDVICFMDNDIVPTQYGWCKRLERFARKPNVGTVTPACNLVTGASMQSSYVVDIDLGWARYYDYLSLESEAFNISEDVTSYINFYLTNLKKIPFKGDTIMEGGGTTMLTENFVNSGGYADYFVTKSGSGLRHGIVNELGLETWVYPSVFLFHYGHATRNTKIIPDLMDKIKSGNEKYDEWKSGVR